MGLGDILGSISPGFGLLSGKGLFGGGSGGGLNGLAGSGLFGLLGLLLHHGSHGANAATPSTAPTTPSPSAAGMASSPFSALGSAMQSNADSDPGVQMSAMPQQSNGLQALLQQIIGQ